MFIGKPYPFMDTGSIDRVRIDVTPTVALTAGSIEVGIASVSCERIMGKMECAMPFALRAFQCKISFWRTKLHVFKGTGMVMVPVAVV